MKNLWFTLLASIILLGIVFFPKAKPSFEVIAAEVSLGNETLKETSNHIFYAIRKQVKRYPQYKEYLVKTDTIRQIVKRKIKSQNTDLELVIPKLIGQIDNEKDAEKLRKYLFTDWQNVKNQPLDIVLNQSELLRYEIGLLNYFAEKTKGSCIEFPMTEFLMLNTKNHFCVGETVDLKYMVSSIYRCDRQDFKIWLNDEPLILDEERPYKSNFKLKPTKIGKNTFEITVEGRNKEGDLEKMTKEFEFWVE